MPILMRLIMKDYIINIFLLSDDEILAKLLELNQARWQLG